MVKDKEVKRQTWRDLKKMLGGNCSERSTTCPKKFTDGWSCMNCIEEFGFIDGLLDYHLEIDIIGSHIPVDFNEVIVGCPCLTGADKNEVILHLEQITE